MPAWFQGLHGEGYVTWLQERPLILGQCRRS